MKTIVSITPVRVDADTRTYKIAASFARFGYRSIVVEGDKSDLDAAMLPFELRFSGKENSKRTDERTDDSNAYSETTKNGIQKLLKVWGKHIPKPFQSSLRSVILPPWYFSHYVLGLMGKVPSASLYYLHAPYQYPALRWSSGAKGKALIYDAHDFYPVVSPGRLFKYVEAWCTKRADAVVTVSDGVAHLMSEEFGCEPVVIRNCQDARLEKEPKENLREKIGLPSEAFLLVSVGQAKPGQAFSEALEALSTMPPLVHLAIVGKNAEQYTGEVKQRHLQSRVHLVPPVRSDEVVPFIRTADASLILYYPLSPNYENCLPNGFFQSVAAELPLLYPELIEIKKLAEHYGLGISLDPQSAQSIREAVMQLAEGADIVSAFKENLRVANLDLSWEHEESILLHLVKGILDKTSE